MLIGLIAGVVHAFLAPFTHKRLTTNEDTIHDGAVLAIYSNTDHVVVLPSSRFKQVTGTIYCTRLDALKISADALQPGDRLLTGPYAQADQNTDPLKGSMFGSVPFCVMKHFLTGTLVTVAHFFSIIQPEIHRLGHTAKCAELTNWFRLAATQNAAAPAIASALNLTAFPDSIQANANTANLRQQSILRRLLLSTNNNQATPSDATITDQIILDRQQQAKIRQDKVDSRADTKEERTIGNCGGEANFLNLIKLATIHLPAAKQNIDHLTDALCCTMQATSFSGIPSFLQTTAMAGNAKTLLGQHCTLKLSLTDQAAKDLRNFPWEVNHHNPGKALSINPLTNCLEPITKTLINKLLPTNLLMTAIQFAAFKNSPAIRLPLNSAMDKLLTFM